MAKPGPQKKPDAIKKMEGNPGKHTLNDNAPEADGAPSLPVHLVGYGKEVWDRIISSMPPQLYGTSDSELLVSYCYAAHLHREAVLEIKKGGCVVTGKGGTPYQNPWVSILNRQAQLIATLGSRLGLDPAARSSINMPKAPAKKSKFAGLVGINGGQTG